MNSIDTLVYAAKLRTSIENTPISQILASDLTVAEIRFLINPWHDLAEESRGWYSHGTVQELKRIADKLGATT